MWESNLQGAFYKQRIRIQIGRIQLPAPLPIYQINYYKGSFWERFETLQFSQYKVVLNLAYSEWNLTMQYLPPPPQFNIYYRNVI